MTRTGMLHLAAMFAALALSVSAATVIGREETVQVTVAGPAPQTSFLVEFGDGRQGVLDATGNAIPVRDYRRIVSGSSTADWLLAELSEPDRIVAVTMRSRESAPWRHRFAGKQAVASLDNIEALLAMHPDLLIIDSYGDPRRVARLREHGLHVFDIDQMHGVTSLLTAMRRIGALLGRAPRADLLARRFQRSLSSLAHDVPASRRPRAMYLSPYGDKLFGGTGGTAYYDILSYAGLRDAADEHFDGFPEYSAEQVLAIAPQLIVTRAGMGGAICRHTGLRALEACQHPGSIIEVDSFVIDDPGLGILEAAEAIADVVHGARPR